MKHQAFRDYSNRKTGVSGHKWKLTKEAARIEEIGRLNDRRLQCGGNPDCLREVAAAYAARKYMQQTAAEILKGLELKKF